MATYNDYLTAYEAITARVESAKKEQKYEKELVELLEKIYQGLKDTFDSIYATEEVVHNDLLKDIKASIKTISEFKPLDRKA